MADKRLSGAEKAAVILLSLGDEMISKLLQGLDEKEIQIVSNYMGNVDSVDPDEIEEINKEFLEQISSGVGIISGGKDYVKKILSKVLDQRKVNEILQNISLPAEDIRGGLEALRMADSKTIASFLKNEHPQTSAIILSHLEPTQAAEILGEMGDKLKGEIALRIATLERIPPGVLRELDEALYDEFKSAATEVDKIGGIEAVAELLNEMDNTSESVIISEIEANDPDLAESIRQLMFVFGDLAQVDDRGMQAILKEVSTDELLLALKTAGEDLKEKVFRNMSERAALMAREDLEAMGPKRISEVEKAQQNILKIAKKLEEEGKIMIGTGGEDFV